VHSHWSPSHSCSGCKHRVSHGHLCGQSRLTARTGLCLSAAWGIAWRGQTGGNHWQSPCFGAHSPKKSQRTVTESGVSSLSLTVPHVLGLLPECSLVGPSRPRTVRGPSLDNHTRKICQNHQCISVACCPCVVSTLLDQRMSLEARHDLECMKP
jgi:hypothetical protein